jgi:DNA-binding SARP family transcriptional activator
MNIAAKRTVTRKRIPLPLFTPEYVKGMAVFTKRYFEELYSRLIPPRPPLAKGRIKGDLEKGGKDKGWGRDKGFRKDVNKGGFVIVFDNYQNVPVSSEFHEMIVCGLEIIPEYLNAIVISRKNPPSVFTRLHASNKTLLGGRDEIQFTLDETRELSFMKMQRKLSGEVLLKIYKRTEGWVAGIVLILEGLKLEKSELDEIDYSSSYRVSKKIIFEYFKSKVFESRDRETQEFLLKTAFFPRMTPQLAERLTGLRISQQILSDLSESHYFTEMFPQNEAIYQYHPLFREFLVSRAKNSFTQDEISMIQRSVATLLEEDGQIEDAVKLFSESHYFEGLKQLIRKNAEFLIEQGRSRTLLEWLNSLPSEFVKDDPYLLYWMGVCRMPFNPEESQVCFENSFHMFKTQRDAPGLFLSLSGVIESIVYGYEGMKPLDRWVSYANELLKDFNGFPSEHIEAQLTCSIIRAYALRRPLNFSIDGWVERLLSFIHKSTNIPVKVTALLNLACFQYGEGNLQELEINLNSIWELIEQPDVPPMTKFIAYWLKSAYLNVTSQYYYCQKVVSDGLELARTTGIHVMDYLMMGHGVLSALKAGYLPNTKRYLQKMAANLSLVKPWQASFYHYTAAWEALYNGNLSQALTHSEKCLNLSKDIGDPWSLSLAHLLRASVSHAFGENEMSADHILKAREIGIQSKNWFTQFICALTEAYFYLKQRKEADALSAIREGLKIGKEKGFVNLYMCQPGVMESLLAKALEEGIEVTYVQNLIKRNALFPSTACSEIELWPWPIKVYTLGRFDLLRDDEPIRYSRKIKQKPLSMLKALVVLGRRDVKEEHLDDLLWPDAEGDAAHSAFTTTLSRLRQMLGINEAIKYREGLVTLNSRYCWVDAWAFEHLINRAEALWKESQSEDKIRVALRLSQKAIDIYKGKFLPSDEGHFWTASYRERLLNKFLHIVSRLGSYLQQRGQWEQAVECYQRALEVDDLSEDFYQNLMVCYQQLGQHAEAIGVYNRCRKILSATLGIEPSPKTETIYKAILSNRSTCF